MSDDQIKEWEAVSLNNYFLVFDAEDHRAFKAAEGLLRAFIDAKNILVKLANEQSKEVSAYYMIQDEAKIWLRENK